MHAYHSHPLSGHFSAGKTYRRLTDKYYFPRMYERICNFVKSCHACATLKTTSRKRSAKMSPLIAAYPFQKVVGDIYGPLPESNGKKYVIIFVDVLTRWPEAKAVGDKSAVEVANAFMELIHSRYGAPMLFLTDHGSEFHNKLMTALRKLLGTDKTFSAPYHPQSHGIVERFIRTFQDRLAQFTNKDGNDWEY